MNYELRDEIGVGSTSKCYRCVRKADGTEYACKVIDKRQVEMKFSGLLDQFFVEIRVLQSLNHPNIIRLEDTFESPDRIYMVMEMMKGGELFDYVVEKGTLSEEEASVLVRKITSAVAHMHGLDIIHRDLKPENLLLTSKGPDAEIKLIDFGLAKVVQREAVASSFLGTKGYLAPEMLQRNSYDKAIDMWALGVIVFVLLCGCLPFDDDSSKIASESAARKKFALRFPKWAASLSNSAKDLLNNLLEINPKTRFTAHQALAHPWVAGKTVQPNSYLQSPCVLGEFCVDCIPYGALLCAQRLFSAHYLLLIHCFGVFL
jgi:serine/threonine protein kinase